ncbi:MAG: L,D-transpeptidase family protein [Rhizobiales bacterium]|nr:L,D-transpeptidase family protein [Hyphomicrobiales bacterium]
MDTRIIKAAAVLAALAIVTPPAQAGGFFDALFGTKAERKARAERRRFEAEQRRQWWLDDEGVLVKRKPSKEARIKKKAIIPDYSDPEPIPGFGMGNVAYVLPRLQPVADKGLIPMPAEGVAGEAIRIVLADSKTPIRADQKVRDGVIALYRDSKFRPLWLSNGAVSDRAKSVLALLKSSSEDGLEPARYIPAGFTGFDDIDGQIAGSNIAAAQFDVALTTAVATYATHLSGGVFDPGKLSLYHDIKPVGVEPGTALKVLAYSPFPVEYLKTLAPQHPAYAQLKAELAKVSVAGESKPLPFPTGKRVKVGQSDDRIPELRTRMVDLGHLTAEEAAVDIEKDNVLDKALSKSLKLYQASAGIAQTGSLDTATVKSFNADNTGNEREKIISSLERLRWLPKNLGSRYVFVNQAAQMVRVMDNGQEIWTSRVVVGRPTTQTSVFNDEMETVVFNPTWGMPQSILINEYLGKLRRDPGYFDRIGYQVVNAKGKKVSSRSVSWGSVGANSGIGVVQPAGDSNALGELKFLFPNSHSIYMHDTPNRELFAENRRAFSHGCVRVQNPREFAKVLLGLTDEEIESRLATGETQNVKVKPGTFVYLSYFTAWPDSDGKIRYYPDIYERDRTLEGARGIVARAFGAGNDVKIVEAASKTTGLAAD